jgi:hypothetical protein
MAPLLAVAMKPLVDDKNAVMYDAWGTLPMLNGSLGLLGDGSVFVPRFA